MDSEIRLVPSLEYDFVLVGDKELLGVVESKVGLDEVALVLDDFVVAISLEGMG